MPAASSRPRLSRLLSLACLGAAVSAVLLTASNAAAGAERNPVRVAPRFAESAQSARVIVKYRQRAHALSAAATGGAGFPHGAGELSTRLGVAMSDGRGLGPRTQVMFAKGLSSSALAAWLAQEADVEWAVVD
ncbi:MAG TPA: hypothetical protein VH328_17050, partial [Burkholderiaceae bacterium]|nr:hypothetical protein [Burkholderiaceae bacterium]